MRKPSESSFVWVVVIAGLGACAGPAPALDEAREELHANLSARPVWSVSGPADTPGVCFGAATAVADFDGDGEPDLAVVELGCFYDLFAPGRVGLYRGTGGAFATAAVWTTLDWARTPTFALNATAAAGDVDGDGRPDLMIGDSNGAIVYAGITSIAAPLGAPTYRVPGTGRFGRAGLSDLDGDGAREIVSTRASTTTVWRASGATLVAARAFAGAPGFVVAGDVDGDGRNDLITNSALGTSSLYRGCAPASAGCSGGLTAAAAWTFDRPVAATLPDLDGDGRREALVRDPGQSPGWLWLHLSDPVAGLAAEAVWSTLGDEAYPALGSVLVPGDVDGDHRTTDFVVGAAGRAYGFFPRGDHHLDRLRPGFAWPRQDFAQAQVLAGEATFGDSIVVMAAAGDLDDDGYDDLVLAAPTVDLDRKPGAVYLFRGGKVKGEDGHDRAPFLPGERTCALATGGLPDLAVDPDPIARSLFVERRTFAEDACELAEACVDAPGERKLLRFTTSIANLGAGPLIIPGPETAPELYHFDECHGHDHLEDFARYQLLDDAGAVVAVGRKQGFFLIDSQPVCSDADGAADYFPDQGISPGWADVYVSSIPCQWLDVTDVPSGDYTLEVTADARHLVEQDDVASDTARVRVRLGADRVDVLDP